MNLNFRQWREHWPAWLTVLLGAVFFLLFLDNKDFWESHQESRRVVPALEILRNNRWLIPTLNGEVFITKPPLYYWTLAATFGITGWVSEWIARIPSVLAATAGLGFIFGIARKLWNKRAAHYAAIICATSGLYYHQARIAEIDMLLAAGTAASVYYMVSYTLQHRLRDAIGLAIATGIVAMTKGPVGLVFPAAALVGPLIFRRTGESRTGASALWMLAGVLSLAGPWLISILLTEPSAVATFQHEIRNNFTTTGYSRQPIYFYVGSLALFAPWAVFLPGALWRSWKDFRQEDMIIWCWAIGGIVAFSLSGQKKHYYLLPLYPALALITGYWWDRNWDTFKTRWSTLPFGLLLSVLAVVALALPWLQSVTQIPWHTALWLSLPLAVVVMWGFRIARGNAGKTLAAVAVGFVVITMFVATTVMPQWNSLRSHQSFFERIESTVGLQPLVFYKMHTFEGNYYLDRDIPKILEPELIVEYARTAGRFIICHPAMETEVRELLNVREVDRNVRLSTRPPHSPKGLVLFQTMAPAP
jgi:4-amino-4-deoxy-L-arabinose transferase-like glycosyltransferase